MTYLIKGSLLHEDFRGKKVNIRHYSSLKLYSDFLFQNDSLCLILKNIIFIKGVIKSGDVQWMTVGKGIVHCEMPGSFDEDSIGF